MPVLVKVMVGYFSTSKKSAERRCASRSFWFVSMLAALIVNATVERVGSSASKPIVPSNS
jgi:hypothetical protein